MNNVTAIIGDTHFSSTHEWQLEIFDKFITWFETIDFGKNAELIHSGDVFEKSSNNGATLEIATKFFNIACNKFKKIHVIGGNHDSRLLHENLQYASQYLPHIGNIDLITTETEITSNGHSILVLPYKRADGRNLDDYYSNELTQFYNKHYDIICGHVSIKEPKAFWGGIDITKFNATFKAFGHIHTRNGLYKEAYCGSVVPNKSDEVNCELPRVIKIYQNKKESLIEIPAFVNYDSFIFGETPQYKKHSDDIVHIYTVINCKNKQQARQTYPDYYIKGVEKIVNDINVKTGEKVEFFESPKQALKQMIEETKIIVKRKTIQLLNTILS